MKNPLVEAIAEALAKGTGKSSLAAAHHNQVMDSLGMSSPSFDVEAMHTINPGANARSIRTEYPVVETERSFELHRAGKGRQGGEANGLRYVKILSDLKAEFEKANKPLDTRFMKEAENRLGVDTIPRHLISHMRAGKYGPKVATAINDILPAGSVKPGTGDAYGEALDEIMKDFSKVGKKFSKEDMDAIEARMKAKGFDTSKKSISSVIVNRRRRANPIMDSLGE